MAIKFDTIDPCIQVAITEKLLAKDYVNFKVASKHSNKIAREIKRRIFITNANNEGSMTYQNTGYVFHLDSIGFLDNSNECSFEKFLELKVRISMNINICDDFTDEFCQAATQFFRITKSSVDTLCFLTTVNCSSQPLNDFLEVSRPSCFFYYPMNRYPISVECCRIPAIRQVPRLMLYGGPLNDNDLFSFKSRWLTLTFKNNFTSSGINAFIKEFLNGLRTFISIRITLSETVDVEKILADIPYSEEKISSNTSKKSQKRFRFGSGLTMFGKIAVKKSDTSKYDTLEITNGVGVPWP